MSFTFSLRGEVINFSFHGGANGISLSGKGRGWLQKSGRDSCFRDWRNVCNIWREL